MNKIISFFIWFLVLGVAIAFFLTYIMQIKLNSWGEVVLITFFVMLIGIPTKIWFDNVWDSFEDK